MGFERPRIKAPSLGPEPPRIEEGYKHFVQSTPIGVH
eukprot:SAG11_NODE_15236_length_584_cov_1.224742_1_plen_36_part_10